MGSYCSFADGVEIFTGGNHRPDWVTTFPLRAAFQLPGAGADGHPSSRGDVVIGSDVWVGAGATILSGTTIGHGAVIGARAVVASPVRPYAVVVGNPGREIRRRFSDDQIDALLRIGWWNWDSRTIRDRAGELSNDDVAAFIRRYDRADQRAHTDARLQRSE